MLLKKRNVGIEAICNVKPLKDEKEVDYWFIENMDIRKSVNWKINEICSDAS